MLNRPSTIVCTGEGLFIWPGILIASLGTRRSEHEIGDMLASLHGPDILRTKVPSATSLAAELVRCGRPEPARRLVVGLPRLPLSPSGKVLVRAIASRLGVSAPAPPESEGERGAATLSHELAKKIAASLDGTLRTALRLEATFCALTPGALSKGDWDADKHPRAGEGPNPGWFAPVDHAAAAASADHNHDSNSDIAEVTPVADFSGGFHDAVVDAWIATFNGAGTPAIKAPAIRMIGTGAVVGFPDILIKAPGVPAEAIAVGSQDWGIPYVHTEPSILYPTAPVGWPHLFN